MNFQLVREESSLYGVIGKLKPLSGDGPSFVTLEHAYADGMAFTAKLAPGLYTCVRHPPNRLHYETFMVTNVPPFQGAPVDGILIHRGNYNKDSEGCILIGLEKATGCILESEKAFDQFMELQKDVDTFTLQVMA